MTKRERFKYLENKSKNTISIGLDDVYLKKGIDTYVNEGSTISQLAIQSDKRKSFFKTYHNINQLLLRETTNPLVEEGILTQNSRDREGEHYLTYEALTLLIEKKIRKHKIKNNGLKYNARNIFIIKNDEKNLEHILQNVELKNGEDAKIIYILGIHSIPFYLRNENGKIKCFIVDSEAGVYGLSFELLEVLNKVFPSAYIILSSTTLQKDFYSCSTFSFKVLLYFVKHGGDIFSYIEKVGVEEKKNNGIVYRILAPENLMPTLLKLSQSKLELSKDILNSVVSQKKKLTLREYFKKYTIKTENKSRNAAAIIKKYKYLDELNDFVEKDSTGQQISNQAFVDLPLHLKSPHFLYSRLPNKKNRIETNPVDIYEKIVIICDEQLTVKDKETQLVLQQINDKFPSFLRDYNDRFINETQKNTDSLQTEKLLFVAAYAEISDLAHVSLYEEFARNLHALFNEYVDIAQYLKRHAEINTKQPVHDLCLFTLPATDKWNKKYWSSLSLGYGHAATKYLSLAPHIDTLLNEHSYKKKEIPNDLDLIKYLLQNFQYKRAQENKELASLCITHLRTEENFEDVLNIVKSKLKSFDLLPDFTIQGADVDKKLEKFTFARLPIYDLRGFFLGEYTSCCQSHGKDGAECAIHGMTSIYSGFYVVYEKGKIVAQTWAWIGEHGEIVFDSWEYINKSQSYICKPFIQKAAEIFIQAGFTKVVIGKGGHTPHLEFPKISKAIKMYDKCNYSDAKSQLLISTSPHQNILDRFETFAKLNKLSYYKFSYLFTDAEEYFLEKEISRLIESDDLTFEEFLNLTKFFYIIQNEFLHCNNNVNRTLILTAFNTYGNKIQPLLTFRNSKGKYLFETLISYNDLSIFQSLIKYLHPDKLARLLSTTSEKTDKLAHFAAKYDAKDILQYVHKTYYSLLSFDEFAALKDEKGQSVLFWAALHNSKQCLKLFLSNMRNTTLLTSLLKQITNFDQGSILHCFAKNNSLESLQRLEVIYNDDLKELANLLSMKANYYYNQSYQMNVLQMAVFSKSQELATYLIKNWLAHKSKQEILEYIFKLENNEFLSTLFNIIRKDDLDLIKFVHQLHSDEEHWLQTLKKVHHESSYSSIALFSFAMQNESLNCALYNINSIKSFDYLHQLLTTECNKKKPLEEMSWKSTNKVNAIIRKILAVYSQHPDKIAEIIFNNEFAIFRTLIRLKDLSLFKDVLNFLSQDEFLFNKLLDVGEYETSLLWQLTSEFNHINPGYVAKDIHSFYDCLFDFCSDEQKKKLFSSNLWLQYSSKENLKYLLVKIDEIDNGEYRKNWASLKEVSPLIKGLYNHHSNDATPVLLNYYANLYGAEQIKQELVENCRDLNYLICSWKNLSLLQYIYPLISADEKKLNDLYFGIYGEIVHNISLEVFEWLINQKEISDQLLIKSLSVAERTKTYSNWYSCDLDNLQIVNVLWKACAKRLNKNQLKTIICEIYWDIHMIAVNLCNSTRGNEAKTFNQIKLLLDSMVKLFRENNEHMKLYTTKDAKGNTLFTYTCEKDAKDLIKMILLNCNHEERIQLIESYTEKHVTKPKMVQELREYVSVLQKLDHLISIKNELLNKNEKTSGPYFFQKTISEEIKNILNLLAGIDSNKLFYCDNNNELKIISLDEINVTWSKVNSILKSSALLKESPEKNANVVSCNF